MNIPFFITLIAAAALLLAAPFLIAAKPAAAWLRPAAALANARSMSNFEFAIGHNLRFARSGETIDAVDVDADNKPDHDPAVNWLYLGATEGGSIIRNIEKDKIYAPAEGAGKYTLKNTVPLLNELSFNFRMASANNVMAQLAFMTGGPINTASTFAPNGGASYLEGWWYLDAKDEANNQVWTMEVWGRGEIDGNLEIGRNAVRWNLLIEVLQNSLNTGTLYQLAYSAS